jgi:hypothetical protein
MGNMGIIGRMGEMRGGDECGLFRARGFAEALSAQSEGRLTPDFAESTDEKGRNSGIATVLRSFVQGGVLAKLYCAYRRFE